MKSTGDNLSALKELGDSMMLHMDCDEFFRQFMRVFKTAESNITLALNNGAASALASSFYDATTMVRPDVAIGNRAYFRFLKSDEDVRSSLDAVIALPEFQRPKSKFKLAICCGPTLLAVYNVRTQETNSIALSDLAENYSTFLEITGQQAVTIDANTAADVKACQQITRLLQHQRIHSPRALLPLC